MTRDEFMIELAAVLERPAGTFSGQDTLESLEWDSLRLMEFITLVDEKLDAEVVPDALSDASTVDDLLALVQDKLS